MYTHCHNFKDFLFGFAGDLEGIYSILFFSIQVFFAESISFFATLINMNDKKGCALRNYKLNPIMTHDALPNKFLKRCPAIPCIGEFDAQSKLWSVKWSLSEKKSDSNVVSNVVKNFDEIEIVHNERTFNIKADSIPTVDIASATSAALGLLADVKMLHHMTKIPKMFGFARSFVTLAPLIYTKLYSDNKYSKDLSIRCGDGAYFDKSSLASIIAAGCNRGNVLIVKSTKSKYTRNPNNKPPCSAYLGYMDDIKVEYSLEEDNITKGRIISTYIRDQANDVDLRIYVIEVFSSAHKSIETMPTSFKPKFWQEFRKTTDNLVNKFRQLENSDGELLPDIINGICVASGGMKTAMLGKRILHDLRVAEDGLKNLQFLSGCSGGLWSIILYFSRKKGTMEDIAAIHARLIMMESQCNHLNLGKLSNLGYYLHPYARLLNWIQNSDYDWKKLVPVIIDEDYMDYAEENNHQDSLELTEQKLQEILSNASKELNIRIVTPFVLLCNSYD